MYEVKVNKQELLGILQTNRDSHQQVFKEAIEGYGQEVIHHLEFALESAKAGKKIITTIKLPVPIDHTDEYDRIIGLLSLSVDDEILIDKTEYRQFVLDQWDWSKRFSSTTSTYSASTSTSTSTSNTSASSRRTDPASIYSDG